MKQETTLTMERNESFYKSYSVDKNSSSTKLSIVNFNQLILFNLIVKWLFIKFVKALRY